MSHRKTTVFSCIFRLSAWIFQCPIGRTYSFPVEKLPRPPWSGKAARLRRAKLDAVHPTLNLAEIYGLTDVWQNPCGKAIFNPRNIINTWIYITSIYIYYIIYKHYMVYIYNIGPSLSLTNGVFFFILFFSHTSVSFKCRVFFMKPLISVSSQPKCV